MSSLTPRSVDNRDRSDAASAASGGVDPFKEMTRRYDGAVVDNGGSSIFVCKTGGPVMVAVRDKLVWERRPIKGTPGPRYAKPKGRPSHIKKPGRIVGRISGNLGGFIQDGFDDMG